MSLEVALTTGLLVPLAAALFYMGLQIYQYLFDITSTLVGWPYP
ncbi:hypothetical protein [Blastopirellula sediminis]|nr:hypothetical protein [Blastopirellula sediminis]